MSIAIAASSDAAELLRSAENGGELTVGRIADCVEADDFFDCRERGVPLRDYVARKIGAGADRRDKAIEFLRIESEAQLLQRESQMDTFLSMSCGGKWAKYWRECMKLAWLADPMNADECSQSYPSADEYCSYDTGDGYCFLPSEHAMRWALHDVKTDEANPLKERWPTAGEVARHLADALAMLTGDWEADGSKFVFSEYCEAMGIPGLPQWRPGGSGQLLVDPFRIFAPKEATA